MLKRKKRLPVRRRGRLAPIDILSLLSNPSMPSPYPSIVSLHVIPVSNPASHRVTPALLASVDLLLFSNESDANGDGDRDGEADVTPVAHGGAVSLERARNP